MAVAALDSAPTVTTEPSFCRAWWLQCGATDLLSSGQECPCCPGPSRPLPVPEGGQILGWSRRPVLPGLCCWIHTPGCAATSAEPPPEPL